MYRSAIAHLYPAYRTYDALHSERPEELQSWAAYWSILGLFHTVEAVSDSFVWWLPFYDEFKIILCIFLALPDGQVTRILSSCRTKSLIIIIIIIRALDYYFLPLFVPL